MLEDLLEVAGQGAVGHRQVGERELGLVRTLRTVSDSGTYIDFARRRNVHEVVL